MAHPGNLVKIGLEMEEFIPGTRGPTTRQERQQDEYFTQKPYPKERNQVALSKQGAIDFNQAAKKYGGVIIIEGRNQVAPSKQGAIDFNQAAKKYGGVIIIEGRKNCRY